MKKWAISVLLLCLLAVSAVGCGGQTTPAPAEFEAELISAEFVYDGLPHGLTLSGDIPEGTETTWTNNDRTLPGVYTVTVELTKEGYAPLTLSATLTITALTFEGLSMTDITVPYGQPYQPAVTGAPEGAEIGYAYGQDGQPLAEAPVLPGEYTVEATVTAAGYETATLSATLTITALTFEGLSMADITVPYGQPYQPAVTGAPEGAEITYTYSRDGQPLVEAPVLPGEYTVEATVTAAGYETATLSAALTITALTFEGLSMADITVSYGQSYQPAVTGLENYPEAAVEYSYAREGVVLSEKPTDGGAYTVTAVVSCTGYETQTLSAAVTITALTFDAAVALEQNDIRYGEEPDPQLLNADKLPDGVIISAFRYERIEGETAVPLDSVPDAVGSYRVLCTVSCANYMTKDYSAEFDILGLTITEIELGNKPYGAYLPENGIWTLSLSVFPAENHEDVPIDFFSSDEDVATVSEDGTVTALKAGSVTITASVRGYSPAVTDAYDLVVFATDRMNEDFETVYIFNTESKAGAGKVPFSAGAGSASMSLSLTDNADELPENGSGTALKAEYTGSAEYSTVEWLFADVTAGQRYELRYAVKVLSGSHNAIFQIRVGENIQTLAGSGAGSRSVVFTATETGALTLLLAPGATGAYTITIDNLTLCPVDGFRANFDNAVVRLEGTQIYAETAVDDYFYVGTANGTRTVSLLSVAELTGSDREKAEAAGMYGQAICITSNIDASAADGYRQIEMGWRLPALSPGTYRFTFRIALLEGAHLRRVGVSVDGAAPYTDMTSDGTGQVDFTVTSDSVATVVIRIIDNQVSPGSRLLLDDFVITAVSPETEEI